HGVSKTCENPFELRTTSGRAAVTMTAAARDRGLRTVAARRGSMTKRIEEGAMRSRGITFVTCVAAAVLMAGLPVGASAQDSRQSSGDGGNELIYEFVGQVQNFAPAGPGLSATSIQYGYISHVEGLSDSQIYLPGLPQNEASALLTFYNDSVTEKVT